MKRTLIYSLLTLIIILSCSVIACSPSTQQSEPANTWAIDFLDTVPENSSYCSVINVSATRIDSDISDVYEYITYSGFWDMYGLETDNQSLDYVVETDSVAIFIGDLDLEAMTENLNVNGSNHRNLNDTEVWDWEYEWREPEDIVGVLIYGVVAIKDELVVFSDSEGDIEAWLDFLANPGSSINNDPDFNDLFCRLPSGFFITYSTNPPEDFESQGFESFSGVMVKKDTEFLTCTAIYKYQDEDAAVEAYPQIKAQAENDDLAQNTQVTREGKYITIMADSPISEN